MGPSKTDQLYSFFTSSNIVIAIDSARMRRVGNVAGLQNFGFKTSKKKPLGKHEYG
jgi:hypothetical protein